ncbi:RING-type E3 ubiquitin transferase [Sarracenia purpurea var. burkii]
MAIQAQLYSDNFGLQNWMESVYGFNEFFLNFPHKQQQQQSQNLQQKTQNNPSFDSGGLLSNHSNHQAMAFSQSLAAQIDKQRQEVDRFISLQNERLRLALQEHRKQQIALILKKCEAKAAVLLKQKDEEIAKAMNRMAELEEFMRRLESENETWQRLARENEAMVFSLNNTIEQLKENPCCPNGAEDAESCCDVIDSGYQKEGGKTEENRGRQGQEKENDEEERRTRKMVCKSCNSRSSCVVFLPCRHLSSCKACQPLLGSCPVCGMVKKAIIDALL